MFDRTEERVLNEREYKKSYIVEDEELANNIHNDTTAYLNGLTDYQILQLQEELKSTVGPGLISKLRQENVENNVENNVIDESLDKKAIADVKNKYKASWDKPSKSHPIEQEIELECNFTEDQLLTALSSKESTLIAHSLTYLCTIEITKWDVLTNRLLPLLVHNRKLVRLKAYKILYKYDSLPVLVVDLLKKSKIDGNLTSEILLELQSS
eukprot:NODE_444_length_8544_cov_0.465127.p3 type:complete len:211 gc:universal NODE_444_length_8544_cov_0.465127:7080-6448(-)